MYKCYSSLHTRRRTIYSIGRQGRADISSLPSSHALSRVANRRKQRCGILAAKKVRNWHELIKMFTYQVVECKAAQFSWLHSKVLECLRGWINPLINEFSLNLIGRDDRPPESFVQEASGWLQDGFGEVDVTTVLDDFLVNQLGDLSC